MDQLGSSTSLIQGQHESKVNAEIGSTSVIIPLHEWK